MAGWNVETQQWGLSSVFDQAFCNTCEAETELEKAATFVIVDADSQPKR